MLATARLRGTTPPNIVLWGVQPERIEIGMELSETLAPLVDILGRNVALAVVDDGDDEHALRGEATAHLAQRVDDGSVSARC